MFTVYMPYSATTASAECLDDDLLWQQLHQVPLLVEAIADHDVFSRRMDARQWRGYEGFLANYTHRMQIEAQKRGLGSWLDEWQDSPYAEVWAVIRRAGFNPASRPPRWIGGEWFLHSNRSQLIRLNPTHYAQRFPTTPMEMPFLIPQNIPGQFDYTIQVSKRDSDLLEDHERVIPAPFVEHVRAKGLLW